jgi:hypothetical protein
MLGTYAPVTNGGNALAALQQRLDKLPGDRNSYFQSRPTMRAAVPVPGDNCWNDHMTQRRITDDPAAFHVDRSEK